MLAKTIPIVTAFNSFFLDVQKAYDTVWRDGLVGGMHSQ